MDSSETARSTQQTPQNNSRSGLWALLGVGVGFTLPIIACVCGMLVFAAGFGQIAGQAAATSTTQPGPTHVSGPRTGPAVAMIDVAGPIVSGQAPAFSDASVAAAGDLIPLIERAGANDDVRAIVLRVNSPGGGVVASDYIYHALEQVDKPIVVLMGDVAASGGVYISMASDYIVANPNTLTGSIGVISQFPNAQELLDKIGVEFTIIKSGEAKDFGSPYRPMEPAEREQWQDIIDETYQRFVSIVADGRGLSEEEVRQFADGRILSAQQALDRGLIDTIGYEEDAIREAALRGNIDGEPRVLEYRREPSFFELLGGTVSPDLGLLANWEQRLFAPTVEYRWIP